MPDQSSDPDRNAKTRSGRLFEAVSKHSRDIDLRQAIDALSKAETAAKSAPGGAPRLYIVNYRVDGRESIVAGTEDERRSAIVELIRSRSPREGHPSTSTWIVELHIPSAEAVLDLLGKLLDFEFDYLQVAEITENRASRGDAKLRP